MILLIDNYDSFTYNIEQMLRENYNDVQVVRNDKITIAEIKQLQPAGIVLSPGPGKPEDAGICLDVIKEFAATIPILGVCLGMQAIAAALGANVIGAKEIVHGKPCDVFHTQQDIFANLAQPLQAARYHSLCVDRNTLPHQLAVIAETADEQVMAIKHINFPVYGVQFHPESILTPEGTIILKQFSQLCAQVTRC